ncbi:acyltransferase family protein [Leucobacter weissii]|uniref:Acyltransferase family protein n=1 Tax=Leucobacter weissii TaxID=1983706 RepID=A0A939S967_9MICO|nr:acyltransferase family protein [Leucobacter weissii]MBO1900612.1 acyltransferase family protein [Leucobacter weissii]
MPDVREAPRRADANRASAGFRTDIQGLRAIAVLLVVIYHAGVSQLSGGFIGVDVFFVISGFLITSHLVQRLEGGGLRLSDFYARRVRRLLPAAWTVAVLTVVFGVAFLPRIVLPDLLTEAAATIAYIPNMLFAWRSTDYLANESPSAFQHYWSLGIEEQFYLFWPLILLLVWRMCRGSRPVLFATTAVITAASFVLGLWLTEWREPWAFFLLPSRAWELGVGALLALALVLWPRLREDARWKPWLAWLGIAAVGVTAFVYTSATPFPGWQAAVPVIGTALVILAGTGVGAGTGAQSGTVLGRVLATAPFQFFGKISYSLYLVHWPLLILPQAVRGWGDPLPLPVTLALGALSIPIAWLCWRFVEEPGRSPKRWWAASSRRSLPVALAGAVAFALAAIPAANALNNIPLDSGKQGEQTTLALHPTGTAFVPNNLTPSLSRAEDDNPIIYDDGCHLDQDTTELRDDCLFTSAGNGPVAQVSASGGGSATGLSPESAARPPLVVLFGNSHAASWFPALNELAERDEIALLSLTKSSCPSADVSVTTPPGSICSEWRDNVLDAISELKPAVVFLGNNTNMGKTPPEEWSEGFRSTIERIEPPSRVVVIEDVPNFDDLPEFEEGPDVCLSRNLDDTSGCAPAAEDLIRADVNDAVRDTAERTGARYLPVTDWLCGETCPPILGNTLVYRDSHHLTETFSREFAPIFADVIREETASD